MLSFLTKMFGGGDSGVRKVPGAMSASDRSGRVVYNMLDPWMQKFMGQCVSALKKEGIKARGTGQFSIQLGEAGKEELRLDVFWSRYSKNQSASEFAAVVAEAKRLLSK